MNRFLLLTLLGIASSANAVVIRDDVPDLRYRMAVSDFPALADLPGEGHGVLVAPQWVLTAAHAVDWQQAVDVVVVGGTPRAVRRIVLHPGYRKLPQHLIDQTRDSDDPTAVTQFLSSSDDIALIELAEPVRDVAPVPIYTGSEPDREMRIVGRGATGNGAEGHCPHGPNRTDLRQGYNRVDTADGRWLGYRFDRGADAHPLEAAAGNGDSGGPILIAAQGHWQVAGITSWKRVDGSVAAFRPGRYGQMNYAVRVAHYREWIANTISTGGRGEAPR